MNTFDLQIQSTASDGKHAPAEIAGMARRRGLGIIAITDHDTVAGVEEGIRAGEKEGVRVIPGIEISVEEGGSHILGYGIDTKNADLLRSLEESRQGRLEGAKKMVENLKRAGFAVEWEDVAREATGAVVARPHLARAVLKRPENADMLGGIASAHDFIEKYLTDENPNYVRRAHISARDAIALIHGVGGVAVWSHPAIRFANNPEGLEKFLVDLIGWGLDGVEAFNPSHAEDDAEMMNVLAEKYHVIRTAGSDFHEEKASSRDSKGLHSAEFVGDYETHGFAVDDIIPCLDEAILRHRGAPRN